MQGELRSWLKREPQPERIRATTRGGDEKTIRIGESRSKWRDAERALEGCTRLEAINAANETLRVWEEGEDVPKSVLAARANEGQLAELARLLNEAADGAAARHENAYKLAYDQQCLLVKVLSERLQALEGAWHRLLMAQAESLPPDDPNLPMVMQVLAQMAPAVVPSIAAAMAAKQPANGAQP